MYAQGTGKQVSMLRKQDLKLIFLITVIIVAVALTLMLTAQQKPQDIIIHNSIMIEKFQLNFTDQGQDVREQVAVVRARGEAQGLTIVFVPRNGALVTKFTLDRSGQIHTEEIVGFLPAGIYQVPNKDLTYRFIVKSIAEKDSRFKSFLSDAKNLPQPSIFGFNKTYPENPPEGYSN
jgi:hypothetical protein